MRNNDYKGSFIAFDGPNGAGKTTLIRAVKEALVVLGYKVHRIAIYSIMHVDSTEKFL